MHGRRLGALVLGAFLAWLAIPLFHSHEEGGHGGEGAPPCSSGVAVDKTAADCVVCELLAVATPGLEPAPPPRIEPARPDTLAPAPVSLPEPRSALFSFVGAPRGPPASTPA